MQPEPLEVVVALIPLTIVVGLLVLAAMWLLRASRLRELREKQLLAMIEKGMAPPPELLPASIEGASLPVAPRWTAADRFRSAGIIFVGIGAAVALIIAVAGSQPRVGLGVGMAVVAIGLAMIVNGWLAGSGAGAPPADLPPAPPPGDGPRA